MITLLIATRNEHKAGEIRAILGEGYRCRSLEDHPDAPVAVEDAQSFEGNAVKKATGLAQWLTHHASRITLPDFVLADDSGLEVDALNGAPGVHSARFAALEAGLPGNSADGENNAKLLRLLAGVTLAERTARFRCALALVAVNPELGTRNAELFEGACAGRIQFAPGGQGGFGYDPLFVPDGFEQSFAQLGEDVKNRLSHRAKALAALKAWFATFGFEPRTRIA